MTLRTRGMNLSTSRAFVKERFGQDGWERVAARLPPDDREKVWETLILPTGWYDYPIHHRFLDAMELELRAEAPNLGREMGMRAAQSDIKFYHSQTIAFVNPVRVLEQCARLWEEHYNEGRMEVEDRGNNAVKIVLINPGIHKMACAESIPGWGEQAIVLAGAQRAHVEHTVCVADGFSQCEYVVDWE
jgi:hypothetical protein